MDVQIRYAQNRPPDRRGGCFNTVAAAFAAFVAIGLNATFATESTAQHRYELSGSATLTLDPPMLQNGGLKLNATLAPSGSIGTAPAAQSGGSFLMTGILSPQSLVCYNDTIFRDDFDGDGL